MKISVALLSVVAVGGVLLGGCLSRPPTLNVRHFVLAPMATNEPTSTATKNLSVGIAFVKMPTYLLRKSIAIRNGANEIEYIEDALWAERLDQSFQRTLAANLSCLLPSANIHLTDWPRDQEVIRIFVDIQQFEVDSNGNGTLNAHWRINARQSKAGQVRLTRTSASPRGHPEVIPTTLSDLAAEFSRELAQSIRESVNSQ